MDAIKSLLYYVVTATPVSNICATLTITTQNIDDSVSVQKTVALPSTTRAHAKINTRHTRLAAPYCRSLRVSSSANALLCKCSTSRYPDSGLTCGLLEGARLPFL